MRIAFIGQKAIPFYRDGGVERHVEELSTRLAGRKHKVTVYVRPRYVATKKDIWRGIRLIRVFSIPTKHFDTISYTFFATLYAVFGKRKYDVIHYHGVGPSLVCWIPRLFTRAKIIVTFHSIDRFHAKWGPLSRAILRLGEWAATHFPHATIAVSHTIQKYCEKHFGKKVHYIPNGVNIVKVTKSGKLKRWGLKKDQYLVTVARLVRHKGIHSLIQAYQRLPDSIKQEMKLIIVGAPSFTKDYDDYLKQLAGGDSRIIFAGYQCGETLHQLYAHAFLYVHPSEYEGLSVTILEAMSSGKCVLISDIPENLEAIDHSGVPFEVGNVDDLTEKLTMLINHPGIVKERGKRALGFIKRNFEWEKVSGEIEELYEKVVKK